MFFATKPRRHEEKSSNLSSFIIHHSSFIISINSILHLPDRCLLNRKITKAFFKRNFELVTSEKSLLDDPDIFVSMDWLASISPASANINSFADEDYLYEEVQVIHIQTSDVHFERNHLKMAELVQKYIPYPILLVIYSDDKLVMNTCDKKINHNDSSKRIIEKRYTTEVISTTNPTALQNAFLKSLDFASLDKTNLKTCFDSYTQRIIALQSTKVNGTYVIRSHTRSKSDLELLEKIEALENEIVQLQNLARKETQLKIQVELNTSVQEKRKEIMNYELRIRS